MYHFQISDLFLWFSENGGGASISKGQGAKPKPGKKQNNNNKNNLRAEVLCYPNADFGSHI